MDLWGLYFEAQLLAERRRVVDVLRIRPHFIKISPLSVIVFAFMINSVTILISIIVEIVMREMMNRMMNQLHIHR
jgi:hypothetical protein